MHKNTKLGIILLCDIEGPVARVLRDDVELLDAAAEGRHFLDLCESESRDKAAAFLHAIARNGGAFNWELNVSREDRVVCLCFAGSRSEDGLLIVGGISRQALAELLHIASESLREFESVLSSAVSALHLAHSSAHPNEYVFDELTRVNNELTNAHRDLAKSNAELSIALRRLAEQNRQVASQAKLLDIAYDAILVRTIDGTIEYWNRGAAQLYGWTAEEAEGKNIHSMLRTVFPDPLENVRRTILEQGAWEGELVHTSRDGAQLTVSSRQVLHRDETSHRQLVLEINRDETERTRTREALRTSDRMAAAARLGSALAHEINNPLAILTNSMFMLGVSGTTPEGAQILYRAEDALTRVTSICRQMLALYHEKAVPGKILPRKVLSDVVAAFADQIQAKHIRLVEEYDDAEMIAVESDLLHVFSSLIRNALENLKDGGCLRIRTARVRTWRGKMRRGLRVLVSDNGPGISREQQRTLFEPFVSTKEQRGAGLGLWTTKNIVEKYAGEIRVRSSTQPDRSGTTVAIFFPTIFTQGRDRKVSSNR